MIRKILGLGVAALLVCAGTARASVVIDFEGVAPAGGQSTETDTTNTFNGFDVFVAHGHYQDSAFISGNRPSNGTDWLLHDHFPGGGSGQPVVVTRNGGGSFSVLSIDASEWENTFARHQTLTLTGHLAGGGTIVQTFTTDSVFGFETFTLTGFTDLLRLDIFDSNANTGSCAGFGECGSLGYDNIVVDTGAVPEPASVVMLGMGLALLGLARRQKQTS